MAVFNISLQTHTHTHTHQNKPEEDRCMHEWCSVTHCNHFNIGSVQFSGSVASNSVTQWTTAHQASLSITNSWSLLKLMSIESVMLSFRMDWLDLLAVQGTLKSLLQYHSSKASVLQRSAFFIVQLSHLYMTTGETIALTRQTMVGKVMSLLFNTLSRLVITFLPRSVFYFHGCNHHLQ